MIDPKKIDINQLPKKFCDGAIGGHGRDLFSFGLTSGNNIDMFATTPQLMKSIALWMNKQVEDYEGVHGVIDMTPLNVLSPIQVADLKKPDIED